jgi:hypothetical protein
MEQHLWLFDRSNRRLYLRVLAASLSVGAWSAFTTIASKELTGSEEMHGTHSTPMVRIVNSTLESSHTHISSVSYEEQ